ncbi:MAG: YhcN/YlaJ family sporulation lipoprotein [Firmicutes bacterium]|nr:YhcN/YlaJ family sporulation lipoprotein [Bacillota bacterium]
MQNKKLILLVFLMLAASFLLHSCAWFRRPEAERQPLPRTNEQKDMQQQERQQTQDMRRQTPQVQPNDQPRTDTMDLAERISKIATGVDGVDRSVVVVISNMALIGVTLEREETSQAGDEALKKEVARRVEAEEPSIVNAYVSANPDIVKQLQDISSGITRGEPISTFFDQITDVLRRMKAESGNGGKD